MEGNDSITGAIENKDNTHVEQSTSEIDEPDDIKDKEPEDVQTVEQSVNNKDPRYEKYLKMVQAVKLKMEQEGLDSSILE